MKDECLLKWDIMTAKRVMLSFDLTLVGGESKLDFCNESKFWAH